MHMLEDCMPEVILVEHKMNKQCQVFETRHAHVKGFWDLEEDQCMESGLELELYLCF